MSQRLDANHGLLQALRHPLRRTILRLCIEEGERLSPKELADYTKQNLSGVSYHVRTLKEHGALELVHTEAVRGSIQHFYEPTALAKETPWILEALGLPASPGEDQL